MARIDWIEQRLQNWARWVLMQGSGVLGYAGVDLTDPTPGVHEPYADAPIPTNEIEASETNDLVQRLPGELRRTVVEWYAGRGGLKQKLVRLCCAESTLHARIERAQRMMADHLLAKQDARKREQQRVEGLVQSAKPNARGFYGAE